MQVFPSIPTRVSSHGSTPLPPLLKLGRRELEQDSLVTRLSIKQKRMRVAAAITSPPDVARPKQAASSSAEMADVGGLLDPAGIASSRRARPSIDSAQMETSISVAGYHQALEQGFYRAAGLDVTIREGGRYRRL
jgi:hypothetical protein